MAELLHREETHRLIGLCMEVHRLLGRGHDESVYKDAMVVELSRAGIPFEREKPYRISYKGALLRHPYFADFVLWDRIILEAKAVDRIAEAHTKQVLNYLAASRLRVGLLVNFGAESLDWKRIVL